MLVDGWNLILSAEREFSNSDSLLAHYRELATDDCRVWIIFDGPKENTRVEGNLCVSYTGGEGEQRADKMIKAIVRASKYLGIRDLIEVHTHDKILLNAL